MEYISKQLAVEELENLRQFYEMNDDCDELVARKCKNAVAALPVADVVSVVHARWVPFKSEHAGNIWYCSVCGIGFAAQTDFCPHCGAKMDGGQHETD